MLLKLMQKRWSSCDEAGRRRLVKKLMKRAGRTTNWGEWSGDDHGDDDDHDHDDKMFCTVPRDDVNLMVMMMMMMIMMIISNVR